MQSKTLLVGIASFILGGLTVATATATINKPATSAKNDMAMSDSSKNTADKSMSAMNHELTGKTGDAYDKAFLADMIDHHQGAIDMATQSAAKAKHDEIKQLSTDIITAQQKELTQMKQWQQAWGYVTDSSPTGHDGMDNMQMSN